MQKKRNMNPMFKAIKINLNQPNIITRKIKCLIGRNNFEIFY